MKSPKIKKYSSFEELKADTPKENISEEDAKKRQDQIKEFIELVKKHKK